MRKIKLKYKDTYIEDIEPGTTIYEISQKVQKNYEYPIIGAKYNNLLVDLNTKIRQSGTVEFVDRTEKIGNEIYEKTLEFLIIVAAKEVFPESDVLINYSLDNGIYCEITNKRITEKAVEKLDEVMKRLIKDKAPITLNKVYRMDAIKYFKKTKQNDKVQNLNYTSNSVVGLYELDDVYDYFFARLAHNAGQIDKYKISYIDSHLFVVNYPNIKEPSKISKCKEHKKIFEEYEEYNKWTDSIGIKLASDLNELGAKGEYGEAIRLFETHYESKLSKVAEEIYKKKDKVKVVLVSGPSSSGKTTTTKKISLYLRAKGLKPHLISLDDYLVNKEQTPKDQNGEYDFDHINATDINLFNKHLTKLLNGERVNIPRHDFESGKKVFENNYLQLEENDILLVEGTNALNEILSKEIKRENKFKIFMSPLISLRLDNHNRIRTTDLRKLRRIVRDSRARATSAEETLKMWHNVDKGTFNNVYPYEDEADAVINSSLSYEIGVLRIYAEPLLYGIGPNSKEYSEAIRLINLLRQFMPISSEEVPKDSMLREFIGGGIYSE